MSKKIIDLGNLTEYDEQIKGYIANQIPSLTGYEQTTNKVTSLSSSSTDTQYPSAKSVYDYVEDNKWDYVIYANESEISLNESIGTVDIDSEPLLTQLNQILTDGLFDTEGHIKDLKIALHIMSSDASTGSGVFNDYLYILNSIHASQDGRYNTKNYTFIFNGTDVEYNDYLALGYFYGDVGSGITANEWKYTHYNIDSKINSITDTKINSALINYIRTYTSMPTASSSYSNKIVQYIGATTSSYANGYFYKCVYNGSSYNWQQWNVQYPTQYTSMPTASSLYSNKIVQYTGSSTSDYKQGKFYKCSLELVNGQWVYLWKDAGLISSNDSISYISRSQYYDIDTDSKHVPVRVLKEYVDSSYKEPTFQISDAGYTYLTIPSLNCDIEINASTQIMCPGGETFNSWTRMMQGSYVKIEDHSNTLTFNYDDVFVFPVFGVYGWNSDVLIPGLFSSPVLNLGKATGIIYLYFYYDDDTSSYKMKLMFRFFANDTSDITSINNVPVTKKYVDDNTTLQVSTLPTASSSNLGKIYQYVGSTTASYTNGYFYKCVSNGAVSPTYSWEEVDVQSSGGGGTVWDYIIDARSVIDIEGEAEIEITDSSLLTQLNQIITDGIHSSGTTVKPLNILLMVKRYFTQDSVNLHLVSISDQTNYQEDTYYTFCFANEKYICYLKYYDGDWTWYRKYLNLDYSENSLNKVSSITSSNKTSTTNYPSNKAIVDYIDDNIVLKITTLPTASVDNLGKVYQFVGTTTSSYTNGYFYKCVSDGQATPTYSWVEYQVQSPAPMYIMSYGNSTWDDFITAYQKRLLVYCRASSNSNPATGSQTRMAFMAYVNNADNPTEVEFQYYRSVSSHSASQQGDQVFVYKLTKTAGWSVTTREASSKIVAGTGLTSSYSSGVLTLTNSISASDYLSKTNTTSYTPSADYHPATKKYVDDNIPTIPTDYLSTSNTTAYTPTGDYNPATKKYVDDHSSGSVDYEDIENNPVIILGDIGDYTYSQPLDLDSLDTGQVYALTDFRNSAAQSGSSSYKSFYFALTGDAVPAFEMPSDSSWWKDQSNYKYLLTSEDPLYLYYFDPFSDGFDDYQTYEYVTSTPDEHGTTYWLDYYANPPSPVSVTQKIPVTMYYSFGNMVYFKKYSFANTGDVAARFNYSYLESTSVAQRVLSVIYYENNNTQLGQPFNEDYTTKTINGISTSTQTFSGVKTFNSIPKTNSVATSTTELTNLKTVRSEDIKNFAAIYNIPAFVAWGTYVVGDYITYTEYNETKLYKCKTDCHTYSFTPSYWDVKTISDYITDNPPSGPKTVDLGELTISNGEMTISSSSTLAPLLNSLNVGDSIKFTISSNSSYPGSSNTPGVISLSAQYSIMQLTNYYNENGVGGGRLSGHLDYIYMNYISTLNLCIRGDGYGGYYLHVNSIMTTIS